jgi:hypothetical protein
MIIIKKIIHIFSDFSYINNNYLSSFKEFFENYLNNNIIHNHKISSNKFKNQLNKFYVFIYSEDFFKAWSMIFSDSIIQYILHMKNVEILKRYMEYKYSFWSCFFEKILYSYSIFFLTIFLSIFIKTIFMINKIIYLYIFFYILIQIFFYLLLIKTVKWNYKTYLNHLNKSNLLENKIYFNDFFNIYNLLNKKSFNMEKIYIMENNNYVHEFEKIWKLIFLSPSMLNLFNVIISISYVLFIIYMMFQNILSLNVI